MIDRKIDVDACRLQLDELADFLGRNEEIAETGRAGLQVFFDDRPDMLLLLGDVFGPGFWPSAYQKEVSIFGEFRADYAVTDQARRKFLFIEFEDASRNSIFLEKSQSSSSVSYEWARRFEHGFSQIVDWHFRIDDYRRTSRLREHFGSEDIEYEGLLVIGRDKALRAQGTEARLKWRIDHTVINSRRIRCLTFDQLLKEAKGRLENMLLIRSEPDELA